MQDDFLDKVYDLETPDAFRRHYDAWAARYDADLEAQGYATPGRCAAALKAAGLSRDAAILDMGCGTGLSGRALRAEGFTTIDGADVSAGMLEVAAGTGAYRQLVNTAETGLPTGPYAAVTAIGVIGAGAAPAALFDDCLAALSRGGLFCFSFNDHTLEMPEYTARRDIALASGRVSLVSEDTGVHIRGLGSTSKVYVLKRN